LYKICYIKPKVFAVKTFAKFFSG